MVVLKPFHIFWCFEHLDIPISDLFRISCFEFRIFRTIQSAQTTKLCQTQPASFVLACPRLRSENILHVEFHPKHYHKTAEYSKL